MSDQAHKRGHRVAQLVQQELGRLLVEGLKDPRIGFTTVTEVRLTPDLRAGEVYVSVIGQDAERQESLAGLKAAAGFLRRALGQRLQLRYVPHLNFVLDITLDQAQRLEAVLAAARAGAAEAPAPELQCLPRAETARQIEVPEIPMPRPPHKPTRASRKGSGRLTSRRMARSGGRRSS